MTSKGKGLVLLAMILGLGGLAASVLSTRWPLGFSRSDVPAPGEQSEALVCYGYVDLEHGATPLYPLQAGRVARIAVQENEPVSAGAAVLYLDDVAARLQVEQARAAVDAAELQLADARSAPEQHLLRLAQQEAVCAAVESKLAAARHLLERKKDLEKSNHVGGREIRIAEEQVKEVEAIQRGEAKKLAELRLRDPQRDVDRAKAEATRARAHLKLAERTLAECTLKAPQAGTVARILVTPGTVLGPQPQSPAVLFFPNGPRVVRAEVEQEFARRCTVGQAVRVLDEVGGEVLGTGHVQRLSDWFLPRRSLSLDPTRPTAGRTRECLVMLDTGQPPLPIGQRVQVVLLPGGPR